MKWATSTLTRADIAKEVSSANNFKTSKVDQSLLKKLSASSKMPGFYLNCSHHGVGQIDAYYIFKTLGNLRIVFYLHDIIPIDFPEYVRVGDEITHQKRVDVMANFSDLILVNSEYTKTRLIENCLERNNNIPPIEIQYIGVEDTFNSHSLAPLPDYLTHLEVQDYFIYVGTIEPRKNHLMILNLWRQYFSNKKSSPKLVLLGKRGWNNQAVFDLIDRSVNLRNSVIEVHGVSDELMVSLIKGSKGVLFPTFVEGWGMPLVEAMVINVPVLASDIPALREAGQGLAEYIDPVDSISWKEAIEEICNSKNYSCDLQERISKFKPPSWIDTFDKLDYILKINAKAIGPKDKIKAKQVIDKFTASLLIKEGETQSNKTPTEGEKFTTSFAEKLSPQLRKKTRKFLSNPRRFFLDSKKPIIQKFGKFLMKI